MNTGLFSGLSAYWPLWEASGSRFDSTGLRSDLADNNTVTGNPGILLNASQFTAANSEYLSVADNAALSIGDIDFTFMAWVYLDSKGSPRTILSKRDLSSGAGQEYSLVYDNTADRFVFAFWNSAGTISAVNADGLGSPALSTWYQIFAWHDATANTQNIRVNMGTITTNSSPLTPQDASSGFKIGAQQSTPTFFWDGRICEVAIWKHALTDREQWQLYNNGQGVKYPFFQLRHKFPRKITNLR
jgi:hypothetical protein